MIDNQIYELLLLGPLNKLTNSEVSLELFYFSSLSDWEIDFTHKINFYFIFDDIIVIFYSPLIKFILLKILKAYLNLCLESKYIALSSR